MSCFILSKNMKLIENVNVITFNVFIETFDMYTFN